GPFARFGALVESDEGGSLAVVVRVPCGAESAGADRACWSFGSLEGVGDFGSAARVGGASASVCAAALDARRPRVLGRVEPAGAARGVGELLGAAGDVAAVAS